MSAKPHFNQLGKQCADLKKTMFSLFNPNFKEILCISIFETLAFTRRLSLLMTVSNTSCLEFDNFSTDRVLGAQATKSLFSSLSDLPAVTLAASDGASWAGV